MSTRKCVPQKKRSQNLVESKSYADTAYTLYNCCEKPTPHTNAMRHKPSANFMHL